jgi:transcriptional regulator of arginine metabolism
MRVETRPLPKAERQRLIASVIERRGIGSQRELLDALAAAGCRATQATISRDMRELGLEKGEDALGRPRYVLATGAHRPDARAALAAVLAQYGRSVTAAENVVVVRSELGTAPAIARALDRVGHPLAVGTLAGDDTCLVIAPSAPDAKRLEGELAGLLGSQGRFSRA